MVAPEHPLVGGTFGGLSSEGGAWLVLLQREVMELQLHFAGGDIVFNKARLYALIESGACRAAEILPRLYGDRCIWIAQDVAILPFGGNAGIDGGFVC